MRFRAVRTAGNSSGGALIGWMAQSALMRRGASLGGLRAAFFCCVRWAAARRLAVALNSAHWRMPPHRESIATMTSNSWRRTAFESISGDVEYRAGRLLDPSGEPLARLYKVFGGPQDVRWGARRGKPARPACRKRCAIDAAFWAARMSGRTRSYHWSLPPRRAGHIGSVL